MRRVTVKVATGVLAALAAVVLSACMLFDVKPQQERLSAACVLEGSASAPSDAPIVVILVRHEVTPSGQRQRLLVDHFVMERAGRWAFAAAAGRYHVAAFEDANRDFRYQAGERFYGTDDAQLIACDAGSRIRGIGLDIPVRPTQRFDATLDVVALQARSADQQAQRTLGQLTAVGEVVTLDDPRFDQTNADDSLWRPFDFIVNSHPGIYFLEPYDSHRLPVLFVHGINGSPRNFAPLIAQLDRTRFQAWVYAYPSGVRLAQVAEHLNQTMAKLQLQHRHGRFVVVAHSMGGLVARGFLLRHAAGAQAERVPLLVTLSTPWAGHSAAEIGIRWSPAVVDVWRDMAPGSDYLRSLFDQPLPGSTRHLLMFTFQRKPMSLGASDDQVVTVASQLASVAQQQAFGLEGWDDTHDGVLANAALARRLDRLLAEALDGQRR
jgi:pimeloyl-ACP methyl ester carboxylesterase